VIDLSRLYDTENMHRLSLSIGQHKKRFKVLRLNIVCKWLGIVGVGQGGAAGYIQITSDVRNYFLCLSIS